MLTPMNIFLKTNENHDPIVATALSLVGPCLTSIFRPLRMCGPLCSTSPGFAGSRSKVPIRQFPGNGLNAIGVGWQFAGYRLYTTRSMWSGDILRNWRVREALRLKLWERGEISHQWGCINAGEQWWVWLPSCYSSYYCIMLQLLWTLQPREAR